jgi:D-arginine dehydrogenase
MVRTQCDIVVVGAGIAGVSVAAHLAGSRSVRVLEMENQPGFHSTGRSAAIFIDFYGNETIRALTSASRDFFSAPPAGFSEFGLIHGRSILLVARQDQLASLQAIVDATASATLYDHLSSSEAAAICPILDESKFAAAVLTRSAADIDVHGLQAGYLRWLRERGGSLTTNARVIALEPRPDGWLVRLEEEEILAGVIVNAAGAWAAQIGALAGARDLGLVPLRRSAALVDPPDGLSPATWPAVMDIDEQFYMKPEAGLLMISPADETPDRPCDVQPEELDIAVAVDRVEAITRLQIRRIRHKWAGLRSFVADRSPVVGFDPFAPNFFWLAALGGYGIQTAPGLSRVAAEILLGTDRRDALARLGLRPDALSPARDGIGPQCDAEGTSA